MILGHPNGLDNEYPFIEYSLDGRVVVDKVRTTVCDNITLYAGKYEEEFETCLIDFMQDVKNLIKSISHVLNLSCIKFDVVLGCVELAVTALRS